MDRLRILFTVFVFSLLPISSAHAVTVWYQPTPYPTQTQSGVHGVSGWLGSYYNQALVLNDDKLQIGGWGDTYRSYLNWDLVGLPKDPTNVALWLRFYPSGKAVTPFQFCVPNSSWGTTVTWNTQPSFLGCTGMFTPPSTNSWAGWYVTSWYQNWQNGVWGKHGIMLNPQYNNNNFDFIRSSKYAGDGDRPILQFDFTPTLEMKMPLSGNLSWLVTTEAGGWDCIGNWYDSAHDGTRYFSIDFSWNNKDANGVQVYSNPNGTAVDIPILAAAGGKVVVLSDSGPTSSSGNYLIVDHDGDGDINTGFTTWYAHMKYAIPNEFAYHGKIVQQGDKIGVMGTTGKDSNGNSTSFGVHLHFGVKYGNGTPNSVSGASTISQLTKVVMDGWILKSFQTECQNGNPIRYYRSSNRAD